MLLTTLRKPLALALALPPAALSLQQTRLVAAVSDFRLQAANQFPVPSLPIAGYAHMTDDSGFIKNTGNTILNHRHIINLEKVKDVNKTVTVSSYNILSRHYLWESLYSYLPTDYTNWSNRLDRLDRNFRDLSKLTDIMCFQEMEYQVYKTHWQQYFKNLGYNSIFQKKPRPTYWKKSGNLMDGVAIVYNTNKFELINYERINFANNFKTSPLIEQTLDTQERLIARNTVAVVAVLKHKYTNQILFVANTHLYWSPKHDDVKLLQTHLLTNIIKETAMRHYKISAQELDEMIKSKNGPNIIMTGDFNSTPSSMVYKFLSEGTISRTEQPNFTQDYGSQLSSNVQNTLGTFKSPYKELYLQHVVNKTTYTPKFKDVIDYIWFANDNNNFKFTKVLGDIDPEYLKDFQGFPNADFPSDHIPILSQIEFN
jgi:CCR4-NOT transcription complex subunit 6